MSPTARTLDLLRECGYHAGVVERWNPNAMKRHDLFGFGDIFAFKSLRPEPEFLIVQATSTPNVNARVAKIRASPLAREWLLAGGRIAIIGWKKYARKVDGKQWRYVWKDMQLEDFPDAGGND